VNGRILAGSGIEVQADSYLFADGLINSLRILDLVAFVERTLDLEVVDTEVTMEHFRTIRSITDHFVAESKGRS
jgi:acyl carrier protein